MLLRTSVPVVAAALVAVLGLAGCGSSGDDGRTVTNQAPDRAVARSLEPTPSPPSLAGSPSPDSVGTVTFAGVTVKKALEVDVEPDITVRSATPAPGLLVQDLVVGTGAEADPTATATLHYKGVLYATGATFDSNYDAASPTPQQLGKAIAGFAQGVGGTGDIAPMRVGGRRLLVFPAALGYGAVPQAAIPAHASLVFVVDLLGLS